MTPRRVIESRITGHRTITGTDWPITDQLVRETKRGRPVWVVITGLCAGVPLKATEHKTLKEAREVFEGRE